MFLFLHANLKRILALKNHKKMKTNYYFPMTILALLLYVLLTSCSSDNDDNTIPDSIVMTIQSGTWKITKFIDSGIDETSDFTGYNFTFDSSGELRATNGMNNFDGTWNISASDGTDLNDLELNIFFSIMNDFDDLTDDWDFISQSSTKIELIDISGGVEQDDFLTFEKN